MLHHQKGLKNLYHLHDIGDLWVFGYGSLMWRPNFPYQESTTAKIFGVHRAPCVISYRHRGSIERPGIVMGLDMGGSCVGRAYRVLEEEVWSVLDYLFDREIAGYGIYLPVIRTVTLMSGFPVKKVRALCFIVDCKHQQYAGNLSVPELISLIEQGVGEGGSSFDYLEQTAINLAALGVINSPVHRLLEAVKTSREKNLT